MKKLIEGIRRFKAIVCPEYVKYEGEMREFDYSENNCAVLSVIQNNYLKSQDGYWIHKSSLLDHNLLGILLTNSKTVCDIGGGLASAFYQLKGLVNIDYTLIEREKVINRLYVSGFLVENNLSCIGKKKYDAILMGSSFQYISAHLSLESIVSSSMKVIILQRTPFFNAKETTKCIQITRRTAERQSNVVTIWNYNDFVTQMLSFGFKLASKDISVEGRTYLKEGLRTFKVTYLNLMFVKK